ncbi:MAG: hypothetical protein B6D41_16575 [Chloroflexi bacterium UTCFX4]|jgi:hypothetical protein|nr:MAG: hypothetical protein B6D41_16575 [Chloroflexi bacterium UTCFX4]
MALAQKKKKRVTAKPRAAQRKLRMTYRQVLARVRALSPADRERLRAELEKQPRVYIMRPTGSPEAIRRGRKLAEEIRKEVSEKQTGTLEETMIELRGLSWSS